MEHVSHGSALEKIKNNGRFAEALKVNSLVNVCQKTLFGRKFRKVLICLCSVLKNYKNKSGFLVALIVINLLNL